MAGKYPKGVKEEDAAFRAALRKVQKFSIPKKNVVVNNDIWSILKVNSLENAKFRRNLTTVYQLTLF